MSLTLQQYEDAARATAVFPPANGVAYCSLKLCGEAGEHAEKVGKLMFRGDFDEKSEAEKELAKELLLYELGDVLWYVANLATLYGSSLERVAVLNIEKLADRQRRGVLKGSGDQR